MNFLYFRNGTFDQNWKSSHTTHLTFPLSPQSIPWVFPEIKSVDSVYQDSLVERITISAVGVWYVAVATQGKWQTEAASLFLNGKQENQTLFPCSMTDQMRAQTQ